MEQLGDQAGRAVRSPERSREPHDISQTLTVEDAVPEQLRPWTVDPPLAGLQQRQDVVG